MSVSKFKTWVTGEVLTASDLNSSFDQVFNNGEDLGWPSSQSKDMNATRLIWDGDQDTYTEATTDDQLDTTVGGSLATRQRLTSSIPDFVLYDDATGTAGAPYLTLWRDSSSPADDDDLGIIRFNGEDSAGSEITYSRVRGVAGDVTSTSPDGRLSVDTLVGGTMKEIMRWGAGYETTLLSEDAGASAGPLLKIRRNSASPANSDVMGRIAFVGEDSGGNQTDYAYLESSIVTVTAGSEAGQLDVGVTDGGSDSRVLRLTKDALEVYGDDAGAGIGPTVDIYRNSASPADDDVIGAIRFYGEDGADAKTLYGQIAAEIIDETATTSDGRIRFTVAAAGNTSNPMNLVADDVLIGKSTADNGATAGFELSRVGTDINYITSGDNNTLNLNRLSTGDNDVVIHFRMNGTIKGSIRYDAGGDAMEFVGSATGFTGHHMGELGDDGGVPQIGTVMSVYPEMIDHLHPKTRVTDTAKDPAVYGAAQPSGDGFKVASIGLGRVRVVTVVEIGDLLCSSDVPGCAQKQADDLVRSYTLGKAVEAHDGDGEGLISAVLMSG